MSAAQSARANDLEREAITTLQDSLSQQLALISARCVHSNGDGAGVTADKGTLAYLAWLLNRGCMEDRVKAAMAIERLAAMDRAATMKWATASSNNGLVRGLVGLIREGRRGGSDDAHQAERAGLSGLAALYGYGAELQEAEIRLLIMEVRTGGLAALLVEQLAGASRAKAERVLTVLNAIAGDEEGRAALGEHALTMPVLVRSLLVISDLANELVVSIAWALTRAGSMRLPSYDVPLTQEAARLGLAQKLLLMSQMECKLHAKHKIRDLLKAMAALHCLPSLHTSHIL